MQERLPHIDAYAAHPAGHFVVGSTYLHGCTSDGVYVTYVWGTPRKEEITELTRALIVAVEKQRRHLSYFDCSGLRGVESDAFTILRDFWTSIADRQKNLVISQAIVRPGGLVGVIVAGFLSVFRTPYPTRVVTSTPEAAAWLELPAATVEGWRHTLLTHQAAPEGVHELRLLLAANLDFDTARAARHLGLSVRTLQRRLGEVGTNFRSELDAARLSRARLLLTRQDEKVASVAHALGFASSQHFARWFQKQTGATPSDFRRAH